MNNEILSLDLDNLDSPQEQEKLDILSRDLLQELFIRSLKRTAKMNDKITQLTNNWNELEKYLHGRYKEWIGSKNKITKESAIEDYLILDFMKYLKENKK